MSDKVFVGKNTKEIASSPEFDSYAGIIINIDDDTFVSAGDTSGRTGRVLEVANSWGTEQMAQNMLSSLQGFQYQPYEAPSTLLDPSAELGDGVTINGLYSGIYRHGLTFGRLMAANISAPQEKSIDHEFPYKDSVSQKISRQWLSTKSALEVQASEISARVEKIGGESRSFGWSLTEDGFVLKSNNKTVFQADDNGITIDGIIKARSGYIGSDTYGFEITERAIRNGVQSMSDTAHTGIYLGTDGIVLGRGAFKVDASGNLYANSGTFNGNVQAGNINYGGSAGYFSGGGLIGGSVGTGQTSSYINGGVAGGYYAEDIFRGAIVAPWINTNNLYISSHRLSLENVYIPNVGRIYYIGWA